MNLDLSSFAFGTYLNSGTGTPSWGTALGQSQPAYKFTYPGAEVILIGMVYCSVPLDRVSLPLGKGGRIYRASELDECQIASLFRKVYINGSRINYPFIMVLVKEDSASHPGRKSIKYSDKITYDDNGEHFSNAEFISQARNVLGLKEEACWFVYSIEVYNQDELHMSAVVVDKDNSIEYENSSERRDAWLDLIEAEEGTDVPKKDFLRESIYPLQQIYFGAPGTGKSYEINRLTDGKEVIRTTFHPDSDYSTFVGAYKPTSVEIPVRDVTGKVIIENGQKVTENRIVYEFVEQAFLQAYTKAWKAYANAESGTRPTEQYLVIEEINRGNCAQIFGDLFQLLDRNLYGFSDYPITADKDMKKQLAKAFKDLTIADASRINGIYKKDVVSQVLSGEILLLPDNLFIWATMNTSDQSLFPIDSAFKRRWDWKYIPISEGRTETGEKLGWRIKVSGNEYDWCQFMNKINHEIGEITKSEDKKIGYFFCKAEDGIINAETFVGKVIFYLWNDVFKDQDVANIFNDGDNELKFSDFYDATAEGKTKIKEDKIEVFLKNLGIEPISSQDSKSKDTDGNDEEIADEIAQRQRKESLISIQIPNYPIIYTKESTVVDSFVKALTTIGIENILPIVDKLKYQRLKCPVISTQKYQTIENGDSGYSYCQAGSLFIIKGCKTYTYIRILEDLNEMLNVGLTLETR